MLGLLLLGVSLCVWRLYEDAKRRRARGGPEIKGSHKRSFCVLYGKASR